MPSFGEPYEIKARYFRRDYEGGPAMFITSATDFTPQHLTYPNGYEPACSCCWLGFPHSEAYHAAALSHPTA